MSSILRALRTLPIYVVTGKTRYNEFHPDAAVPCQDTGTSNSSTNAGGALRPTSLITDITGLVAWKDYIPVQEEAGRTVPYSYDANGYFPIKMADASAIFTPPVTADTWGTYGNGVVLSNGNKTATFQGAGAYYDHVKSTGSINPSGKKVYFEVLVGGVGTASAVRIGVGVSTQAVENVAIATPTIHLELTGTVYGLAGGGAINTNGAACQADGTVIGVAYDATAAEQKCDFYKNGVANGSKSVPTALAALMKIIAVDTAGTTRALTLRTTSAEFSYSPPTGYIPWAEAL